MAAKLFDNHVIADGSTIRLVLREVVQYLARTAAAATTVTDSSGGTADAVSPFSLGVVADAVNTANSGTSLAGKAAAEAAMLTLQNAFATLFAKANTCATALDLPNITYSGGGSSGGNTVAAITVAVTAATTGVPAAAWNVFTGQCESALYQLGRHVNMLCAATGKEGLDLSALKGTAVVSTVPVMTTATGTAVDPGTTAVKANADMLAFANHIATVTARLNAVIAGAGKPGVAISA